MSVRQHKTRNIIQPFARPTILQTWPARSSLLALAGTATVPSVTPPEKKHRQCAVVFNLSGLPVWLLTVDASWETASSAIGKALAAWTLAPAVVRLRVLAAVLGEASSRKD